MRHPPRFLRRRVRRRRRHLGPRASPRRRRRRPVRLVPDRPSAHVSSDVENLSRVLSTRRPRPSRVARPRVHVDRVPVPHGADVDVIDARGAHAHENVARTDRGKRNVGPHGDGARGRARAPRACERGVDRSFARCNDDSGRRARGRREDDARDDDARGDDDDDVARGDDDDDVARGDDARARSVRAVTTRARAMTVMASASSSFPSSSATRRRARAIARANDPSSSSSSSSSSDDDDSEDGSSEPNLSSSFAEELAKRRAGGRVGGVGGARRRGVFEPVRTRERCEKKAPPRFSPDRSARRVADEGDQLARSRALQSEGASSRSFSLSRDVSRSLSPTLTLNFPRTRSRGIPRAREGTPHARILRFSRIRSLHRRPVRGLLSHVSPLRKRLHSRGRRRVRIAGVRPGRGLARRTDGGSDDSVR